MTAFSLEMLEEIIDSRSKVPSVESWTAQLVSAGQTTAAKKLGEEAIEAVVAAVAGDRDNLTYEAADLLYHLLVVLKIARIPIETVMAELARRTAQSGVLEKASRQEH